MIIFETVKLIAEVITSIATATVVIVHLVKLMFKLSTPLKLFFKTTVAWFFKGIINFDGKKIRFCKALKLKRAEHKSIMKAIAPKFKTENILVLTEEALYNFISNSDVIDRPRQGYVRTISLRLRQKRLGQSKRQMGE